MVADTLAVLAAVEGQPLDDAQADAVGLLALVASQDVEPGERDGTWRIVQGTAKDRVISTVDPDSRHVHKTVRARRDGFKATSRSSPKPGWSPTAP